MPVAFGGRTITSFGLAAAPAGRCRGRALHSEPGVVDATVGARVRTASYLGNDLVIDGMDNGGGVAGSRIVVVDDEERVADVYASFLDDEYETEAAYSGQDALDAVDGDVDLVLLDRRMPGLSGDEVLERLRDRGYEGRVVLVTALDPGFDVVGMPFEQYVTKPVGRDELRAIVHQELLRATYDDALQEYLRLRATVSAIESDHPDPDVTADDRLHALRDRLDRLRDELLETLVEHAEHEYENGDSNLA